MEKKHLLSPALSSIGWKRGVDLKNTGVGAKPAPFSFGETFEKPARFLMNDSVNVPFLNLTAQYEALKSQLLPAVEQVLAGGHYVLGPNVAAFEQEIAAFTGAKFGVGVNSGSDALTLALRALDLGPGDEVITTPFTYIAPAESIVQMGAKVVFADIDPRTFIVDPAEIGRAHV